MRQIIIFITPQVTKENMRALEFGIKSTYTVWGRQSSWRHWDIWCHLVSHYRLLGKIYHLSRKGDSIERSQNDQRKNDICSALQITQISNTLLNAIHGMKSIT